MYTFIFYIFGCYIHSRSTWTVENYPGPSSTLEWAQLILQYINRTLESPKHLLIGLTSGQSFDTTISCLNIYTFLIVYYSVDVYRIKCMYIYKLTFLFKVTELLISWVEPRRLVWVTRCKPLQYVGAFCKFKVVLSCS